MTHGKRLLKGFGFLAILFVLLAPACFVQPTRARAESTSTPTIQTQFIDTLDNSGMIDSSLALDSAGNPHVCYIDGRNDSVKYAWWNGSAWINQIVDTAEDGIVCSLALDSKGNPYITYRYLDAHGLAYLKFAQKVGSAWKIQVLGMGGDYSSIAVDSHGNPHIAYYGEMSLQYASWDGSKWTTETVESGGSMAADGSYNSTGWWVSLKLDANDNPHISYFRYTDFESNGEIKYANWNGAGWVIQHVDWVVDSDQCTYTSLALDSNGTPRIAYRGDTGLMYATYDGSSWRIQAIDSSFKPAYNMGGESLVLDPQGNPYISYVDAYRDSVLKLAFLNGTTWEIEPLTPIFHGGYSTSIAMDSNGTIHICRDDVATFTLDYYSVKPTELPEPTQVPDPPLKIAVPPSQTEDLSPEGTAQSIDSFSGAYTSLALDSQGNPHLSYFDRFMYDLRYAYSDGTKWYCSTVDTDGWVGFYSSLALDANGYPCISYLDESGNTLKYAQWNGSTWNIQTVCSVGNRYSYTSLALDAKGYPHISYFDGSSCQLKYASWNGTGWNIQTVDASGFAGEYCSLRLDGECNPCISYYDAANGCLKYAAWTGSSWSIQTVDSGGNVGASTSLALDQNGNAHISYYDVTGNRVKYAYHAASGWIIQSVADSRYGDYVKFFNSSLDYTSLGLDSNGNPFISYTDGNSRTLKLAFWNDTSWVVQTVDSTFDSGWTCCLVLDKNNVAHLSYYEGWKIGDLMYATSPDNATYFTNPVQVVAARASPGTSTPSPPPMLTQPPQDQPAQNTNQTTTILSSPVNSQNSKDNITAQPNAQAQKEVGEAAPAPTTPPTNPLQTPSQSIVLASLTIVGLPLGGGLVWCIVCFRALRQKSPAH